mmetsp:Transcript_29580/g.66925  ORF Transcript_29580/g.66925 Transcript_29580/m.66925 type:complete len:350 (-) Transcript_29580:93-1142(-)|eukprot:758619-Hanusia_phi.AAC.5
MAGAESRSCSCFDEFLFEGCSVLVLGLGGGADAQGAYALAQYLQTMQPTAAITYGTVKGVKGEEEVPHAILVPGLDQLLFTEERKHDPKFLLENVGTQNAPMPRWVGTVLYEQTIPHQNVFGSEVKSPIICRLNTSDAAQQEKLAQDLYKLTIKLTNKPWDLVVGLDHGGDVLGGVEEGGSGRDIIMSRVLDHMVSDIQKSGRFLICLHGLCIDGENYFDEMTEKIEQMIQRGAYLGRYPIYDLQDWLRQVCAGMPSTKTPMIMLDAIDGKLEVKSHYNSIETHEDRCFNESDRDVFGDKVDQLLQCTARHHHKKDGSKMYGPIVPRNWATSGYLFDGHILTDWMRSTL